ncbi:ester cyclase [bacterium BMS3Abin03]|jgi:hypothetical protein|nr:ester cyclase [bacterium BMS3Abin03]
MKNLLSFLLCLLLIAIVFISCQKKDYSVEMNPIIDKYLDAWNNGNLDILDEITSLDFELRINPDFEANEGRDFLKESITKTRTAYPDFLVEEDKILFVSDTAVVVHWTITGTNTGKGIHPPTGKKTSSNGFSVIFFADGKLTGEWIGYSDLTWVKQLGFTITPPSTEEDSTR